MKRLKAGLYEVEGYFVERSTYKTLSDSPVSSRRRFNNTVTRTTWKVFKMYDLESKNLGGIGLIDEFDTLKQAKQFLKKRGTNV